MPWKVDSMEDQKHRFIADVQRNEETFADICRKAGISRKTGYKWLSRYRTLGMRGLVEMSRTARLSPHAVSDEIVRKVLSLRALHPKWGPKKLRKLMEGAASPLDAPSFSSLTVPAVSTVGAILKRHGLCAVRRRVRRVPPDTQPFAAVDGPNASWSMDYKGQWKLGDGTICYPFTLTDNFSRKILRCQAMSQIQGSACRLVLESAFREYGLPATIRSDNGAPFAGRAVGGLTRLTVWLIKLGIRLERIDPGCPEQNGRHERMHRTMIDEGVVRPPSRTLDEQQKRQERWVREFNEIRPHEALQLRTPDKVFRPSKWEMPLHARDPEYGPHVVPMRVELEGHVRVGGLRLRVGMPLQGELVGIEDLGVGRFRVWFNFVDLGTCDIGEARRDDSNARYLRLGGTRPWKRSKAGPTAPMDADAAMDDMDGT